MEPITDSAATQSGDEHIAIPTSPAEGLRSIATLLGSLEEVSEIGALTGSSTELPYQTRLTEKRLGLANSLFLALRAKHAPTAAHSLRVALAVSSWSYDLGFADEQRDVVEIAALLHDIGKIGIPDHILLKPGKLDADEMAVMERHGQIGRGILACCCPSAEVLDIVSYAGAWFDGSRRGYDRQGDDLPFGARMIAIVNAFDAMTTDHVYRKAMSRERAVAELYSGAGTQFDGELVQDYCQLLSKNRGHANLRVARRWLREIQPASANHLWTKTPGEATHPFQPFDQVFLERLLDTMRDGVIFVDDRLVILHWNRAAERLTGISASGIVGHQWMASLVGMHDEHGHAFSDGQCPVVESLRSGVQTIRRLTLNGVDREPLAIDLHVTPVIGIDHRAQGAALILHDASSQLSLEQRVQTLQERATRDPLTKVANRAEFERVFDEFVNSHLEQGLPCSLIMCDIDHFKEINDNFGHQAGDEALIKFAAILQREARSEDFIARYGGEEFVILCPDCTNAAATRRAEQMRRAVAQMPQPSLGNQSLTASFGVTEIQDGDTAETFLCRVDRALLQAKDAGRNQVVQLGTGWSEPQPRSTTRRWWAWWQRNAQENLFQQTLYTIVPLKVTAEKLRGFIADHQGHILSIEDNRVVVKIDGHHTPLLRRVTDRPVPLVVELVFDEQFAVDGQSQAKRPMGTIIRVTIRPGRQRDRRHRDHVERARKLVASLKSYLVASDSPEIHLPSTDDNDRVRLLTRASHLLAAWFGERPS